MSTTSTTQTRRLERQASRAADELAGDVHELRARADHAAIVAGRSASAAAVAVTATGIGALTMLAGHMLARTFGRSARRRLPWAGIGALSGVTAGAVMNQVHTIWSAAEKRLQGQGREEGGGEPATVKAAESAIGPIDEAKKPALGSAVHYAMSASMGAVYGSSFARPTLMQAGRGLAYGAAVWLLADEVAVPALGLGASSSPPKTHVRALLAHLVYGATLDAGLRLARAGIRRRSRRGIFGRARHA